MTYLDTKSTITELIQTKRLIQAFDLTLAKHIDEDVPEYQRENDYKRLIQRLLLVNGGIPWEEILNDSLLADDCLDLLRDLNDNNLRAVVTACLLKLLSHQRIKWVRSDKWRPKTIDFISKSINTEYFLKQRNVDFEKQSHEVIAALEDAVCKVKRDLENAIDSLTSLSRLNAHRNQFQQIIRRPDGWAVFGSFLPTEFQPQLSEMYSRVDEYIEQRDSVTALDHFEIAIKQTKRFTSDLEGFDTEYSRLLASSLGSKLLKLLEEDFKGNKAAQPAHVKVATRDKKYPFHTKDIDTNLGLLIENVGPGYANEVKLLIILDNCLRLSLEQDLISPGRLGPGEKVNIDIPVKIVYPIEITNIAGEITWRDFDRSIKSEEFNFALLGQQGTNDWEDLVRRDPYSLEPVETEQDLVGRKDLLNRLIGTFDSRTVGSAIIRGQKRVGKTSIAKTVGHELEKRGFIVIFLEQGDYIDPDPRKTVALLGERLCRKLQRKVDRLKHLASPPFIDSLAPLSDFLDDVTELLEGRRIVFVLDEFDELPPELYMRGDLGDALFMTLRSLSSRNTIGFLLVGGEKMAHVSNFQGIKLNKWKDEQVDYFSRETEWADYRELIERPVYNCLEYSDSAIERLYSYTAGNPFFTKQLCGYILRLSAERRDSYVTADEVEFATERAIQELSTNIFQHFWDDGIIDVGDIYIEKTTRRRKILIAVAVTLEKHHEATLENISSQSILHDVVYIENELRELVNRKVLRQQSISSSYTFMVHLFYRWLQSKGITELISMLPDPNLSVHGIQAQELLRIKPAEIVALVEKWGTYKGQQITTDKIRAWLEQFGGPREQRLMFKLLQGCIFYTQAALRGRMKEIHGIVRNGLFRNLGKDRKTTKYSEILIGYLDGPDKSGAKFARLYAEVAEVYVDNVVEKSGVVSRIEKDQNIQALVFVDDFVGTGNSVIGYLRDLVVELQPVLIKRPLPFKIVFAVVVAHHQGWSLVQQVAESLPLAVEVRACEILDDSDRCFSSSSKTFPDPVEREAAKELAIQFGKKLEKNTYLGYGNLELAVVFEDNCPNNTLPILRAESSGQFVWKPLFKRS